MIQEDPSLSLNPTGSSAEKHLAADDTHNIFGSKMLVRRLRRSCKKLLLLFMIGVTVCLGIVLHTSPQSVHLDQLQQAYEEFQSHVTTGLRHQEKERYWYFWVFYNYFKVWISCHSIIKQVPCSMALSTNKWGLCCFGFFFCFLKIFFYCFRKSVWTKNVRK